MKWRQLRIASLIFVATACGDNNLVCTAAPPCALGVAIVVTVTAISGGNIPGAFVQTPDLVSPLACTQTPGNVCSIVGSAGTYELTIGAPGYTTIHRTVAVTGATHSCGCSDVNTQQLAVSLTPNS